MTQELLNKTAKIKWLANDILDRDPDEMMLDMIIALCEEIERGHQIEKRLESGCDEWATWIVIPCGTHPDDGLFVCDKHISVNPNTEEIMKFDGEITCQMGRLKNGQDDTASP